MPTLTPQDQDTDERYNPSQQDFVRDFEKRPTRDEGIASKEGAIDQAKARNDSAESQVAGKEKQAVGDSAVGKAAGAAAGAAGGPVAGAAVKLLGKIKTKKGGVGAGLFGVFLLLIFLGLGFLGPGILIVQVKEALTDKFNDTAQAMQDRNTLIVGKKMQNATAGCTVKVKCRFKGMSERQIKKIEGSGVTVNRGGPLPIGSRVRVTSMTMPDGTVVTASNYRQVLRDNPAARGHMQRAFNPRAMAFRSKAFDAFARKFDIDKRKRVVGNNPEAVRESMRNSIDGTNSDGGKIGRGMITTDPEGNFVDDRGNVVTNPDGTPLTQAQVDEYNRATAEFDRIRGEIKDSGDKIGFDLAKGAALTTATAGLGTVDILCTGYYIVQTVGVGAKVIGSQQLIRYAFTFMNFADAIKAGDATAAEAEYIGDIMTDTNKYDEAFTDSFGYRYAAHDSLVQKSGSTPEETSIRQGETAQFNLGGGIGGALLDFNRQLNAATGGAPASVCRFIKNPFVQVGLLIGGIGLTIGSGGANIGAGTIAAIAAGATLSILVAVAIPTLQNMAAGTLVTPDTTSTEAGDAVVAGVGGMNAQVGQAHGLSPLTKDQVAAAEQKSQAFVASYKEAERAVASPFDITNPATPAFTVASTLTNYLKLPQGSSVLSVPGRILGASSSSLFSSSAKAASSPSAQYEICTDEIYNQKNYAADPFCNIRFGLTGVELELDPDVIIDYMIDRGHIGADGKPTSAEFVDYIKNCISRSLPMGSTDESNPDDGSKCNEPGPDNQNNYFRVYYLDTIINDDMDDEDTFGLAAPVTVVTPAPTTPTNGSFDGVYENGRIPAEALCLLGPSWPEQMLRCDAKEAFLKLNAAYQLQFGQNISVTDSYRSFEDQVRVKQAKPSLAATPGKSNHGWGLALDLGGGINRFGTPQHEWMKRSAPTYGWIHPSWAQAGGSKPEAWHWEFGT